MDIEEFTFVSGVGNYQEHTACLMSAAVAKWRMEHGEDLGTATDLIDCVDWPIRRLAISINDQSWWKSDKERTEILLPFVDIILNTKGSIELIKRRAFKCADFAVRVFLPLSFEAKNNPQQAKYFRSLPEIKDRESAILGKNAAYAAYAAYAADAAVYYAADAADDDAVYYAVDAAAEAAAYAAYAAYAADAAVYAAADAAYAADAAIYAAYAADAADAAAADAAADASYAADAKIPSRTEALRLLTELCEMKD